jgi:hypothetical protein
MIASERQILKLEIQTEGWEDKNNKTFYWIQRSCLKYKKLYKC